MNQRDTKSPSLSVVMPVHNGIPFLEQSISSILDQTFTEFEFVILDDASTDGSDKILREWEKRDNRIRLFRSDQKLGLSASSNLVVEKSAGSIVARMDADDISHRDRLRRQWEIFESRSDVVVVGTLCEGIDAAGRVTRPRDRWRLVRRSRYVPFPHGSAMFRRDAFDRIRGYDEQLSYGEDQEAFHKLTTMGSVVTLPDALYYFRYHADNATLVTGAEDARAIAHICQRNGHDLAGLYLLGAMRLWAGQPPQILPELISKKVLRWNLRSLLALSSATLGSISPVALRFLLRAFIRSRDLMAGLVVKDGRPYQWRLR
jgi:glycosyltransferase involved in cell wall biosynthesis